LQSELTLLDERIASCKADPLRFVKYAYPWKEDGELAQSWPHGWQIETLEKITEHLNGPKRFKPLMLAVASGHGIGKSALISWVIDWALSTCVDCRVTVTAGTGKQLETKTWPEITKWFKLSINEAWWEVKAESICARDKNHERTWRCDVNTWSKNNPGAFAGLHNAGKRIVIIYDESSTIEDIVWEVTSGALTDENTEIIWIAFGNPTEPTGRFAECFGKFRHRWDRQQIDSREVPGTNKELFDEWIHDYGIDSDFVRVRVRGVFPRAGTNQFIAGEVVLAASQRDVGDQSKAYKILSVDVARFGDNQTVIGYRQGLRAKILDKMRGADTIEVGRQVIMRIIRENPRSCVIDGDGVGGGVVDYVRAHLLEAWKAAGLPYIKSTNSTFDDKMPDWWRLEEFHGGFEPSDKFMYFNKRAESWGRMRDWLATGEIPDDSELKADLQGPQYFMSGQNQIQLERKEDMKKRNMASPDNGDMLAMTFGVTPTMKTREEALAEQIAAVQQRDPLEAHFMRVTETERRQKAERPLNFWE
jgi:hypothetical protein